MVPTESGGPLERGTNNMARRLILLALAALLGGFTSVALAQQDMTMEQYEQRLSDCQNRKRGADSVLVATNERIEQVRGEIADIDNQITSINQSIMESVDSDSSALADSLEKLDRILQQLRALRQLSANQIVDAREAGELDRLEAQLQPMKDAKIYALPEVGAKIQQIERLIAELRAVERPEPPVRRDQYTVVRGDNLWNISKKAHIYGNALAWVRLYTANRDMIEDPNLIYPDWVIGVPRNMAPGTYWVADGDNLSDIAGRSDVYGDPTGWTRLFDANRDAIQTLGGDEHTIYPHMILNVPQN